MQTEAAMTWIYENGRSNLVATTVKPPASAAVRAFTPRAQVRKLLNHFAASPCEAHLPKRKISNSNLKKNESEKYRLGEKLITQKEIQCLD